MLISEEKAVELCAVAVQHSFKLSGSKSRFLRFFEPNVARVHARLINDFWALDQFKGKRILDIGPGLFPFSILARELGATVVAIEFDQALADFGRALDFEVHTDNLDMLPKGKFTNFDGLFLKGPFNPCRQSLESIYEATSRIAFTIGNDGWAWIANSVHPRRSLKEMRRLFFKRNISSKCLSPSTEEITPNHRLSYLFGSDVQEIGQHFESSMVKALALTESLAQHQKQAFENLGWAVEKPNDYECQC